MKTNLLYARHLLSGVGYHTAPKMTVESHDWLERVSQFLREDGPTSF